MTKENLEQSSNRVKRSQAVALGLSRYIPDYPCKWGHASERRASDGRCVECERLRTKRRTAEGPEKRREQQRAWRHANLDKRRATYKKYRLANLEKSRQKVRDWREEDRDRARASVRAYRIANPSKIKALNAKRRASAISATPPWADTQEIEAIYERASKLTQETGVKYHVDHIVPILGKTVCGLHVPANLQVITAEENIRKGNLVWPDMWPA